MLIMGQVLENRYQVISYLGEGGMSRVYLVKDLRLDNRWVLKEFSFKAEDEEEREALEKGFISEAKFCARLSHVSIPKVIDYFTLNDTHYIVEELVEGESLLSKMNSKRVSMKDVVPIAIKICDVLEYIHSEGIVYRDLKPDNIMMKPDGTLKLIDFGIARIYKKGKTKDTIIIGTPGYASPEQYGTSQTDFRSDIYSLGALMHHMVTGRDPREKPFNFDSPSSMGIKISNYLENIIMKALSLKPEKRYAGAEQMKSALEAVLAEMTPVNGLGSSAPILEPFSIKHSKTISNASIKEKKEKQSVAKDPSLSSKGSTITQKIIILVYAVFFFMLFILLFEMKFKIWLLIPYFVAAWGIVALFLYMARSGKKKEPKKTIPKQTLPADNNKKNGFQQMTSVHKTKWDEDKWWRL